MKKIMLASIVSLFMISNSFAFLPTFSGFNTSFMVKGEGTIYRVVDGDTYVLNVNDISVYNALKSQAKKPNELGFFNDKYKSFRVRLGNVDTAESVHPDKSKNSAAGKTASHYVKEKLEGQKVDFSCWQYGIKGRAICSVILNGEDFGLHLIKNGYSTYYTKFGKHPYLDKEYRKYSN